MPFRRWLLFRVEVVEAATREGKGIIYPDPASVTGCFEITAQYLSTSADHRVISSAQARLDADPDRNRTRPQATAYCGGGSHRRTHLAESAKAWQAVGLLPDRAPKVGEGRWLDFFGKPAYTMTLAARLTSGAAVIMVWAERLPAGASYHFHLQAPTQPIVGTTEARAQQISREIEILIRQCPQPYLWDITDTSSVAVSSRRRSHSDETGLLSLQVLSFRWAAAS